ncbi:MAG: PDR/VanB family oxidoreductase [Burkholderiaceae bacterium]
MNDTHSMFGVDSVELKVRVSNRRALTSDVVEFCLEALDGSALPGFSPGAHIAVQTPSGAVRQYSLIGTGAPSDEYRIAIKREPDSRGGSSSMIEDAQIGAGLTVSEPKNDFVLEEHDKYLFIAAGIGITPIYTMAQRAQTHGAQFRIIYLARTAESAPYLNELTEQFGEHLVAHFTMGNSADRYDFWDDFASPSEELVYCCGPKALIEQIKDVSGHWPEGSVRFEDFKPVEAVRADDRPFEVELRKSGKTFTVPADRSIIEAMRANGVATTSSCESGTCGTCKVGLVSGEVDHRDLVLSDADKASHIMICVSRAASGGLVLDL